MLNDLPTIPKYLYLSTILSHSANKALAASFRTHINEKDAYLHFHMGQKIGLHQLHKDEELKRRK